MPQASIADRRQTLYSVLERCGYQATEIAERFPIWAPGTAVIHPDFVTFTHADQRDMSTSAIVAQVAENDPQSWRRWITAAASVAAPAVLLALPDRFSLWSSATDFREAGELTSVPITEPDIMANRLAMLTPMELARSKTSTFQGALFPLGLDVLTTSRERAREFLNAEVEEALKRVAGATRERSFELTPKLVIGALATLMIRDKSHYELSQELSTGALIDIAQQQYPGYFEWLSNLNARDFDIFSALVSDLKSSINFASLEPSMVSYVYEKALVTPTRRRQQGTFYTPPELAEQMLRVIPIESFAPEKRHILDPACGSGTLLLAAADRLNRLSDERIGSRQWHTYLTSHLRGFDADSFATEITKLCLLMSAMPIGNSWNVETVDTLQTTIATDERPSIIVSNPPWMFTRSGMDTAETANHFLKWMLDNIEPGGIVACVMPLSWLSRRNSRDSRKYLLENADLLETWRLPSEVFHDTRTTTAPAVVIAQKRRQGDSRIWRPTLVKAITSKHLGEFFSTGFAEAAYLAYPGENGGGLTDGPLSRAVANLDAMTSIGEVAKVHNGAPAEPGRPTRTAEEATHLELGSLRGLREFLTIDPDYLRPVRYPEDYHRARPSPEWVTAHKVVVSAKNFGTRNPWRIAVGYDDHGVSMREMFHMVIPDTSWEPWANLTEWDRAYALMAVLGSGFASCLIDEHEPTRNIELRHIKTIPFPQDPRLVVELAEAGRGIADACGVGSPETIQIAAIHLEAVVNSVFRLSDEVRLVIARRLDRADAPEGFPRYRSRTVAQTDEATLADRLRGRAISSSFGHVLNASQNGLRLWISGYTDYDGVEVSALRQIPGWLCEEGADFTVSGELEQLEDARFGFHVCEWLSDGELMAPADSQEAGHST